MSSFTISVNDPSDVTFTVTDGDVNFKVVRRSPETTTETPKETPNDLTKVLELMMKSPKFNPFFRSLLENKDFNEIMNTPEIMEILVKFVGNQEHFEDTVCKFFNIPKPVRTTEQPVTSSDPVDDTSQHYKYTHIGNLVMPGMYFKSVQEGKVLNAAEFAELQKMFEPNATFVVLEANSTTRLLNPVGNSTDTTIKLPERAEFTIPVGVQPHVIPVKVPMVLQPYKPKSLKLSELVTVPKVTTPTVAQPTHIAKPVRLTTHRNVARENKSERTRVDLAAHYENMLNEYMLHEMLNE